MNDLDRKIKSILNEKLDVPDKYNNMIMDTLNNLPEKQTSLPAVIKHKIKISFATACCVLGLATSIVFAEEITEFMKYIFNFSKSIDKAVENGYIQNADVQTIKSNGTVIIAENFLMDDFNLSFTFKVDLENQELLNNASKIEFLDMIITDEENNILYCEDEETFNEYCTDNNLNYIFGEFNEKYISVGDSWYNKDKQDNEISLIYNLYGSRFPNSKKLFIDVSKIKCISETDNNEEIILDGDWKIALDVPEKFYNRECAVYTITNCSESTLNVTDMTVYNTGTRFEFNMQTNAIYDENDAEEVKNEKISKFFDWNKDNIKKGLDIVNNIYLEDEHGNKYYPTRSTSDDKNAVYQLDGNITYYQTFDLIQYEDVKRLKIHLNLNLYNESKEIIIEFERNS